MFVGHGFLAFALVALAAHAAGRSREQALLLGVAAGALAMAPDADIVYAPTGIVGAATVMGAAEGFWSAGNVVHRTVTHSLVVGVVAAASLGALARGGAWRVVGLAGLAALLAAAGLVSGALGLVVMWMSLFVAVGIAATVATIGLPPRELAGATLVAFVSHPFGDLLTGEPPALLYPLDVTLLTHRIEPFADPTINVLAPFALEVATAWLAVGVFLHVRGGGVLRGVRRSLSGRAGAGATYAVAAVAMPAPTLETSYHFVFSVLGVAAVIAFPARLPRRPLRVLVTGLATVTLAGVAYTTAYLLVGA